MRQCDFCKSTDIDPRSLTCGGCGTTLPKDPHAGRMFKKWSKRLTITQITAFPRDNGMTPGAKGS